MRRLIGLALLTVALIAADRWTMPPSAAEAAGRPGAVRPQASPQKAAPTTRTRRAASVRLTRQPAGARPATQGATAHIGQRVRRASTTSVQSAPLPRPAPASVARRLSTQRPASQESVERAASLRRVSTSSAAPARMGMLPRIKIALRRWTAVGRIRTAEAHVVEAAEAEHLQAGRTPAGSGGSRGRRGSAAPINWPPNLGFHRAPVEQTLPPGTHIDRYGYEGGRFVSPAGTPYAARALPPGSDAKPYNVYVTTRPVSVKAGQAAPWFNQPGMGTQYYLSEPVRNMVDNGALRRASP